MNDKLCVICQEHITDTNCICYDHELCKNTFHLHCIKEWCGYKETANCPLCNAVIDNISYNSFESKLRTRFLDLSSEHTLLVNEIDVLYKEIDVLYSQNKIHLDSIRGLINDYDLLFSIIIGLLIMVAVCSTDNVIQTSLPKLQI